MPDFLKDRLALIAVLTIFVVCKIPHLYYPYYWDESQVYAPAVHLMTLHGPSLLPGAISTDFSRGHPLLFPALFAAWANIFGESHFSMHFFALLISSGLIIAMYETGLRVFNKRVAIISIILLVLNIYFFVQAAFVLPDVLICLFVLLSLYYYATEQYLYTAAMLTLLFLTKESGLVLGVIIGGEAILSLPDKSILIKKRLLKLTAIAIPVVVTALFFIYQKHVSGWYLFPEHMGLINTDPGSTIYWLRNSLSIIFEEHGAYCMFFVVPLLSIIAAVKQHNPRYLFIFLPVVCLYFLKFSFALTELLSTLLLIAFFSSFWICNYSLAKFNYYSQPHQKKFILLSIYFSVAYLYFSSINFFEVRYLFPIIIIILLLIAVLIDLFISKSYPALFYPGLIIVIATGLFLCCEQKTYIIDEPFSRMKVQQQVVNYLEQNNDYDKTIYCVSYLEGQHLKNPAAGFLKSEKVFKNVSDQVSGNTELAIFDNIEMYNRGLYDSFKTDTSFHLIYRAAKDSAWAEIYQRR